MKMSITQTLQERGARYGQFEDHAVIAQGLQDVMRGTAGWQRLAADQKQALTVIADKVARMLNGDPSYVDNWHDIIGYATLVENRMMRDQAWHANDNAQPCCQGGQKNEECALCITYAMAHGHDKNDG